MGITLDKLVFDDANPEDGANVGAYVRAGDDGTQIGSQNINTDDWLNTAAAMFDGSGNAITSTGGALDVNIENMDFDIRDLSHTQDSIKIGDGVDFLAVNNDGSINVVAGASLVNDDEISTENPQAPSASVSTDAALTALSAAGDKAQLQSDLYRRLLIDNSAHIGLKNSNETVGVAAAQVLATPLAGRIEVTIQNKGPKSVFIGSSASVTTANGTEIPKGASASFKLSEFIDIYMIASAAGTDVRFLEAA